MPRRRVTYVKACRAFDALAALLECEDLSGDYRLGIEAGARATRLLLEKLEDSR